MSRRKAIVSGFSGWAVIPARSRLLSQMVGTATMRLAPEMRLSHGVGLVGGVQALNHPVQRSFDFKEQR